GVREADEPGVGDHLEFERDPALLPLDAGLELPRRAVRRRREILVPAAAFAALADGHLVAGLDEVFQDVAAVAVADDRARGDEDDDVAGVLTGAEAGAAGLAALGLPVLFVEQR